jgi:hypothetical protein
MALPSSDKYNFWSSTQECKRIITRLSLLCPLVVGRLWHESGMVPMSESRSCGFVQMKCADASDPLRHAPSAGELRGNHALVERDTRNGEPKDKLRGDCAIGILMYGSEK